MKAQLLIPAAGMGTRLGCNIPKALLEIEGQSLLVRSLARFACVNLDTHAVVVCPPNALEAFKTHLDTHIPGHSITLVPGGAERQDSVERGLAGLEADTEIVAIHDAARPFIAESTIEEALAAARDIGAATVAVPVIDTILQGLDGDFLETTPDRKHLWACQTPQVFQTHLIGDAHAWARREGITATDDATLVRRMGCPVKLVCGTYTNIKITTREDMVIGATFIREGLV